MTETQKRTLKATFDVLSGINHDIHKTGATLGKDELADTILMETLDNVLDPITANHLYPVIYAYACIISALDGLDN